MSQSNNTKCDKCRHEISNDEWASAGFWKSKLQCPQCGTIYKLKMEYSIGAKLFYFLLPMLLLEGLLLKMICIFVLGKITFMFCTKEWFERVK